MASKFSKKIRGLEDPPEVIMISGHGTIETAVRATKLGAYDFAEKPAFAREDAHPRKKRDRGSPPAP